MQKESLANELEYLEEEIDDLYEELSDRNTYIDTLEIIISSLFIEKPLDIKYNTTPFYDMAKSIEERLFRLKDLDK